MLTCIGVYALYLVAVLGWVRTHMDLLGCAWFRRRRRLKWALAVGAPAGFAGGAELVCLVARSPCQGGPALDMIALAGAVGIFLLVLRPWKKEPARVVVASRPPVGRR